MDLKTVFSSISQKVGKGTKTGDELLAVKISSSEVSAATWRVTDERVELGAVAKAEIKSEKFTDLLAGADQAISQVLESGNGRETETEKVVFGLPFHWIADGKIIGEKLNLLRQLCQELDLKPLGFVLLSEALENYYKEIEGAPLTAILLEFDNGAGLLTMYRAGKSLGTALLKGVPSEINEEIEKALKKFTQPEILPSRIIIYDGKGELEQIAEKITAYPWTKNLPFLHFPRVEILPSDQVVKAVAVTGGTQMGGHFDLSVSQEDPQKPFQVAQEIVPEPLSGAETTPEKKFPEESKIELEEVSAQEAGFLPETEFEEVEVPISDRSFHPPEVSPLGSLQEMAVTPVTSSPIAVREVSVSKILAAFQQGASDLKRIVLSGLKKIPLTPKGFTSKAKVVPILVLIIIFILSLAGLAIYFLPRVTVFLQVSAPPFNQTLPVTVVTEKSTNPATDSAKVISGSFIDATEIGTKKGVASGRQLVGDKAKGVVTIYSATSAKTFASGTTIVSPSGLKFTLDHNITVASGDAITHATVTGTVTAFDIGDSYNLPSGTKFTIANFSSSQYAAQPDQALSGGNSHEATVVTKEDQSRLLATLSAELTRKAQDDLVAKLSPGQKLLPNAITSTISKKKFSHNVGDEADTVSLDLTMDFSGIIFSQSDLISVFARNFSSDIPSGFQLSPDNSNIEIKDIKSDKSGNTVLNVHLGAKLVPKIVPDEIVSHLAGKSLSFATLYLSQIPGVTSASFETQPKVFAPVMKIFLPWKKENIKIEVVTQ